MATGDHLLDFVRDALGRGVPRARIEEALRQAGWTSDQIRAALTAFAYPGNVRQLENVCHWLTVMAPGQLVDVHDLPPDVRAQPAANGERAEPRWEQALDSELARALADGERAVGDRLQREFERTLIRRALVHTGGHRMDAAARLGWGRNTLTRRIRELGMDDELRKST